MHATKRQPAESERCLICALHKISFCLRVTRIFSLTLKSLIAPIKTAHSNGPWSGQEGRGGPSPLARPQLRRPRLPLRTPRTQRETCCRGRCGDVQHDGQHFNVIFDKQQIYMGMSTSAAARPPRPVRPVPHVTWATRGRAGCTSPSLCASTPPLPPLNDLMMCMGPRASTRSRASSPTAAHEGLELIFALSTRSRAPITRAAHQRPLSPFQTLRREAPKKRNPTGVI